MQLKNKRILLTGATGGIGRHIAVKLADQGAHIALVGRDAIKLKQLQEIIVLHGGRAVTIAADFEDANAEQTVIIEATKN